jgi:hypothetical protein
MGGSEVITAMVTKNYIIWYKTPCSPLKAKGHFVGACCLYLNGR